MPDVALNGPTVAAANSKPDHEASNTRKMLKSKIINLGFLAINDR